MLDNCFAVRAVPCPPSDYHLRRSNITPQITTLHALGHSESSMSCGSQTPTRAYKTILLKQKKVGETGTKLRTGQEAQPKSRNRNCPGQTRTYGNATLACPVSRTQFHANELYLR
jgi:hypothetical protein